MAGENIARIHNRSLLGPCPAGQEVKSAIFLLILIISSAIWPTRSVVLLSTHPRAFLN